MANTWQQPVSGEPSLGEGHWRGDSASSGNILDQNPPVAGTWYEVTFSNAPEGAKAAWAFARTNKATAGWRGIYIRKKGDTTAYGFPLPQQQANAVEAIGGLCRFPLDSSKKAEIATDAAGRLRVWDVVFYDI